MFEKPLTYHLCLESIFLKLVNVRCPYKLFLTQINPLELVILHKITEQHYDFKIHLRIWLFLTQMEASYVAQEAKREKLANFHETFRDRLIVVVEFENHIEFLVVVL